MYDTKQINLFILISIHRLFQTGNTGVSDVISVFGLLVSSRFLCRVSRLWRGNQLVARDLAAEERSSLNDQIEHILSRSALLACSPHSPQRQKHQREYKKIWEEAAFLVKTRTPERRPTPLEDVATKVLSRGRGYQHSRSDWVLLGTYWISVMLSNGASGTATDNCQLSQFWGICFVFFLAIEFRWACTTLNVLARVDFEFLFTQTIHTFTFFNRVI